MKLHLLYYCYWEKTSKVGRALKKTYRPMAETLFLLPGTGICSSFRTMTVRLSSWKADFEKSLWENYNVTPEYYEDLGDGIYQVYVKIDGKTVPYVCVDSATGDYHG